MVGCKSRISYRNLFRKLKILPFASQYIYKLMLFVVNNINLFLFNSDNNTIITRQSINLHQPITNITTYQKGVCCMGIKVFNGLPIYIKETCNNPRKFKTIFTHLLLLYHRWIFSVKLIMYWKLSYNYYHYTVALSSPHFVTMFYTKLVNHIIVV